ncbi:RICIN domain-containing protein [Streptomyces europaeiscabiei]|uniref:RICIN domain-containing protein n=1 Tax=Streptomyces europaeiscabiei TaxID=146819 RepID=UPI000E6A0BBC|nr:RICIN domain-containing protein [Streptomyces europaeiscabiei]MDX2523418.1 family 43 glycosylhydrolase [Streptomyces europaeiscabiei]MDX2773272.1 family 43 glycosylhydrolase [Streptomyces europaeiscabiei]MDX3664949.1 family 43 glycosylhydrolase [Streptomyces europaeiscabiei]MDX3707832.1 family 43 glycosylhydrolase [Streptomyces europaeiscabiei]MDX3832646.1 family 43 glycosylhydrolase [Streptomyces europaeiscabiei]
MRRAYAMLLALCLALAGALVTAGPAQAAAQTVTNGTQFTDSGGNALHAHGGGVIKVGSYYYWFGENRNSDNTFRYVSAYRSTDLKNWEFRNNVLTQATAPELATANIERPKVMYNASTGKFVMWMHKENGTDYSEARAAVAVSDTVDGNYTWQGSFRPLGTHMSRDITVFVDTDGTGYMISAARENYDLQIYRLTADYTGVAALVADPWHGGHREAPALFKRGGVYFMLTSGATGWNPNQQQYATATSITGPWTAMANVGDSTTFGSQTAYVLPVQGTSTTSYLYMGDRWGNSFNGTVNDSRYVWLPLTFPTSTTMSMSWSPEVTVDTATGTVSGTSATYNTLIARHSAKCADVTSQSLWAGAQIKQYTCNSGNNQKYWFKSVGSGYYQLMTRHSSLCVQENATTVTQEKCNSSSTAQQWSLTTSGSYVKVVSRATGECLDVNGASTADSAAVITYTCGSGTNQQWTRGT